MTCFEKLHQCKSLHELAKTMNNFPRKYGDFEFSSIDAEGIKICHGYMFNGSFDWDIENFPFKDLMLGEVGPEGKDGKEFWPYIINGDTGSYVCDQVVTSAPTLKAAKKFAKDLVELSDKYEHLLNDNFTWYFDAEVVYRPEDENDPDSDKVVYSVEEGDM